MAAEERALLRAVIAAPADDLPRLVYADWLEEHGDPDRAEFIRVQCRLADMSPADPDWVDLSDREEELAARLRNRFGGLEPPTPPRRRFYFGHDFLDSHTPPFRRGFPYFIADQTSGLNWTPDKPARLLGDLEWFVANTTVRGLELYGTPPEPLAEVLRGRVLEHFTGLDLSPDGPPGGDMADYEAAIATAVRGLLDSPAAPGLQHLDVSAILNPESVRLLTKAKSLGSLRRLTLGGIESPDGAAALVRARWFRQLRQLRVLHSSPEDGSFDQALGELPHLHTLSPGDVTDRQLRELAAGRFPALAEITLPAPKDVAAVRPLVGAAFPRLAVLTLHGAGMRNEGFDTLLRADWFARLRVLRMKRVEVGDKAVVALFRHPVAQRLRTLLIREAVFGKTGLAALARAGAFPELTTLNLGTTLKRKASEADVVAFLEAWSSPRLRHLNLDGWPVGDAGAKVIARSPAFAGLTRLSLDRCKIGDAGAQALIASPYLQNLVQLRLHWNSITTGADALADPAVMPRLVDCWLTSEVPPKSQQRIKATGRYIIF